MRTRPQRVATASEAHRRLGCGTGLIYADASAALSKEPYPCIELHEIDHRITRRHATCRIAKWTTMWITATDCRSAFHTFVTRSQNAAYGYPISKKPVHR